MLNKQGFNIPFGQGLDSKTDPNQVATGKMLALQNAVFGTGGQLKKRNGFGLLSTLPDATNSTITTLNGNLIATGANLQAYAADIASWVNRGTIQPVSLKTLPTIRNSTSQINCDAAVLANGLACYVYTDALGNSYYNLSDSSTGQVVVQSTQLVATAVSPKVFIFNNYFLITYMATVGGTPHLQAVAVPQQAPGSPGAPFDISTAVSSITAGYDGAVIGNKFYVAWDASDGGRAVRLTSVDSFFAVSTSVAIATKIATQLAMTVDNSGNTPVLWFTFYDSASKNAYATAYNVSPNLAVALAPVLVISNITTNQISCLATNGVMTLVYENSATYSYNSVASDYLSTLTCTIAGIASGATILLRSVGLASRIFTYKSTTYMLSTYNGAFQPTYFLNDLSGNIISRLAPLNAGGYVQGRTIPSVSIQGSNIYIPYLLKTLLTSVNKSQGVANVAGIYAQTGINLATFGINNSAQYSSEIANTLHLTGGQLWMYDGVKPVEHGFHVYPEDLGYTTSTTTGFLAAQIYFYIATYEWTDAQGNLHRSAPSVPLKVDLSASGTSTNINTINVPMLRLTYKGASNPVRIVVYRWSTAQQNYYQVTSIPAPNLNSVTADSISISDNLSDASILGNTLLYTTGSVVEDVCAPASSASTLFKSRLFIVNAENRNEIWYSKQVLSGTPVEMSNLFTRFVPPTIGAQGSTGPVTALAAMDDKLIIFKQNAIYYMTGTGPDNTGAQNDFSDPYFISSAVGCSNPNSIVLTQSGIMFQSDKGIWLLGRDLSTKYVGADVEAYNATNVLSAISVPASNQVRFLLDSGVTLMYDYYYNQWGTFNGIPALSSTINNGLHTLLNKFGQVLQETPKLYLDNANPVLLSCTSAWLKLTNLQGFQRAYYMSILGTYVTPHKLQISMAYDYYNVPTQSVIYTPTNVSSMYGSDTVYGSSALYGGSTSLEQLQVFFKKQKCQAIQVTIAEIYDPSMGIVAGAGLTMSGINIVFGAKDSAPRIPAVNSVG